jgi:hypothetical protein
MKPDRLPSVLGTAASRLAEPLDLVDRVNLGADQIMIDVRLVSDVHESADVIRHVVRTKIKRRGVEMRLVIEGPSDGTAHVTPDKTLIKAIVRAHGWFDDLVSGRAQSANAIAKREGITDRYVSQLLPLAFLAPDIVEKILAGTQPVDLTAEKLIRRIDLPLGWAEQKALLGVD